MRTAAWGRCLRGARRISGAALRELPDFAASTGLFYPSSALYNGLSGVYDFGPLGSLLRSRVEDSWRRMLRESGARATEMDASLLCSQELLSASGHLRLFADRMRSCPACQHVWKTEESSGSAEPCPQCASLCSEPPSSFNMLVEVPLGVKRSSCAFLRPETCQAIFAHFKSLAQWEGGVLPFGAFQIGRSYRNEINPSQFLFRLREFYQMELEFFCAPAEAESWFAFWRERSMAWIRSLGLPAERLRFLDHPSSDLAHYSRATSDIEYLFPFGWREIAGISNRGDYDLRQHSERSGTRLYAGLHESNACPFVVEPSFGLERLLMALLCEHLQKRSDASSDFHLSDADVLLRLPEELSPFRLAVLPITKAPALIDAARGLHASLHREEPTELRANGSIGKRYLQQDRIGTKYCVTIDSRNWEVASPTTRPVQANRVTVRERDSRRQYRLSPSDLASRVARREPVLRVDDEAL